MAYARDFNNTMAIWTAFNGQMSRNITLEYDDAFRFTVCTNTNKRFALRLQGRVTVD